MTPGSISRIVVADKVAMVRRMLDGIRSLPLGSLADFIADTRMVAAGDSFFGIGKLNERVARKIQRRIDGLDAAKQH